MNVWVAFLVTLLAGAATGLGGWIGLQSKDKNYSFLAASLGFSAGVMVYVSLVEIFAKARSSLTAAMGDRWGFGVTTIAFFAGIGIIALIDNLVPKEENPHEVQNLQSLQDPPGDPQKALMRMGVLSALAIGIHNFPEGMATFIAALQDPSLGISIAVAIAIHNIPEGIAVSVPIYFATGNKKKAFWYSLASGMAEPVGALIGYLILRPFMSDTLLGIVFAMVAGIMVYISIDELLPTAEKYGRHHVTIAGFVGGMAVMALSLVLL